MAGGDRLLLMAVVGRRGACRTSLNVGARGEEEGGKRRRKKEKEGGRGRRVEEGVEGVERVEGGEGREKKMYLGRRRRGRVKRKLLERVF